MPTYVVKQSLIEGDEHHKAERLVDSKNKASAIGYVAGDTISADLATPHDIQRLVKAGVTIESAAE